MFKKTLATIFVLAYILTAIGWAQEQGKSLSLSLDECILRALKNNINIAVEVLSPQFADLSVAQAQEKYLPSLSFGFNKRNTISASYSWIDAADNVSTKLDEYSALVNQLIPTGGNFSVSLESYKNNSNRSFQTINPRFGSTLTFSFSQPLLKNFGLTVNRREILIARNNLEISEIQLSQVIQDTIYNVTEAYWNLVYSIEDLKVKRQSLKLAQDLLAKNQKSVEIGTLAPIEILSAQSEVATREADILLSEAMVRNNEDRLKTILNLSEDEERGISEVIARDKPQFAEKEVDLDQALVTAMEKRPDLKSSRIDLKNQEINLTYAKNQLLPNLSFTASYWSPGISGTQIIYADNNPLTGIPISRIPGGSGDSLKDAFNFRYKNWNVGLTLDISLSSFLSKAAYAQAKVNLEQVLLRLKNQEKQVFLEIKNAVRAVETGYKRVQAYGVARELAEKKLEAEEEKLRVGLSTNYFVLTYQRELANSRTAELKAIIDYNLSMANLDRVSGTSLEARNIKLSEFLRRD